MKRKLFFVLILTTIISFTFLSCKPEADDNHAPVITDAFFIAPPADTETKYYFCPATNSGSYTKLTSINRYSGHPNLPPYFLYIKCNDPDLDAITLDELSIPNLGMPLNKNSQMPAQDSYIIWGVCYTFDEIPDSNISDGKYTFQYQLVDKKGNKSKIFEITIDVK